MSPLSPGTKIERYTIVSVLGRGATGIVYLVKDEELDRRLMLKEHAPEGLCTRSRNTGEIRALPGCETQYIRSLGDFLQEATVLTKLRLPAVPEVYEVFEAVGTACCILSYVEGQPLPLWLAEQPGRRGLLPVVLAEALRTLGKLHRLGIRHRDIKPGHIILDGAGAVNFIDFGAACAAGTADASELVPAFTPPYSPPEQGVPEMESAAGDIYSLGATFYEVTLGEKAPAAMARLEGTAQIKRLSEVEALRAEFPPAYLSSLDQALELEPQNRYATAEQWVLALTRPAEARPERPTRRSLLVAVMAVIVAVIIAMAVYLPTPPEKEAVSDKVEQNDKSEPSAIDTTSAAITDSEPPPPHDRHIAEPTSYTPTVQEHVYDVPNGEFCGSNGFLPTWQGVCVRIDLEGCDDLSTDYMPQVMVMAWEKMAIPTVNPAQLLMVITDAEGREITRSCKHRYNAETKTLTFTFAVPFKELQPGWQALVRMPHQRLTGDDASSAPIQARRAVFYTTAVEPLTQPETSTMRAICSIVSCPFGIEPVGVATVHGAPVSFEAVEQLSRAGYPYAARMLAEMCETAGKNEHAHMWQEYAERCGVNLPPCSEHAHTEK